MAARQHRIEATATAAGRQRRVVAQVFVVLLALLALTMAVAQVDFGWGNVVANLAIASVKTLLILWYFMHLREMETLLRFFAVAAAVWLGILFAFGLSDFLTRGV